ncbi:MAG: hypothetical protein ABSF14_15365 [Terriglobia bacterium]
MGRALLSVLLATVLWVHSGLSGKAEVAAADSSPEAVPAERPTLKEKVTRIPAGSQVEVRLLNQERIRGRLGEISAEAFTVQVAKGNQIDTRRLAFSDVKSVKQLGGEKGKYILIGVGIALVVIVVLAVVVTRTAFKGITAGF